MDAQPPQAAADSAGARRIELLRRWILVILVLGLLGTVTELVLLEHYEQPLQFVPLVLIAAAVGVLWWELRRHDLASRRAIQIVMGLFVLAGFAGFAAHFYGSAEYQLELNPDMSNWELLEKILRAKAPPLLAPGMMLQLGLLGLAYVFSGPKPSKE
jgi:uncharacterized membrane protein